MIALFEEVVDGSGMAAVDDERHRLVRGVERAMIRSTVSGMTERAAVVEYQTMSGLFGATLRAAPGTTEAAGHQLLLRGAFVKQVGQGLFALLPLGRRVAAQIEMILRREMNAIGGQELILPVVHPAELWKAAGRYDRIGPELARFDDRQGRPMVLAMTNEEAVAYVAAGEISSYRQLPRLVYQIQTKFRDDPRPRAGLVRVREFVMKDAYSLDRDEVGLNDQYETVFGAYERIFACCGLPAVVVGGDVGIMGGSGAHEFMYVTPIGEDTLVICNGCGAADNRQVAVFVKPPADPEEPLVRVRIETPGASTIERLAGFLGVSPSRCAKAMMMIATVDEPGDRPVVAIIRGDLDLNETKLANLLGATDLRPMTAEEVTTHGMVPGYASAIGATGVTIVADDSILSSPNLVAGANEEGWHLTGVNVPRDFAPDLTADIAAARDGDSCSKCGSALRTVRAVEVGNIFRLGTKFAEAFGARFLDEDGVEKPIVMGCYGIGVERLMACLAEEHRDERGLRWPAAVAPFLVHICAIMGSGGADVATVAEACAAELQASGISVLYDDRDERPGVKFADSELIGCPLRVTVSARSLAGGGAEVTPRDPSRGEAESVPPEELVTWVRRFLDR